MQTWWGFYPGKVEGEIKYRMYLVVAVNADKVEFCPGKVEGEIKYRMYLVVAVNSDMVGVLPRES
jgi:hypothetical protein